MSKQDRLMLNRHIDECVTLLRSSCPISLGGAPISKRNREIFSRCVESWLFLIEDLMMRHGLGDDARRARRMNFVLALTSADIVETLRVLETCYALLIERTTSNIPDFKRLAVSDVSDNFPLERLLSPLRDVIYQALTEPDDDRVAQLLGSAALFLRFPRKLEFNDIGLEHDAIAGYLETERQLPTDELDDPCEIVEDLKKIIKRWFGDFHLENLLPSHGPGSVAEGSLTLTEKFHALRVDKKLRFLLNFDRGPDRYLEYFPQDQVAEGSIRTSRTIFVPKTATKLRTISMEPAVLQYIQQGVMYALYRYIGKHPYLGVHVRLDDQTQNQVWACVGSQFQNYGTIDLSHASDSVSWALVRRAFASVPQLLKWLLATRSTQTVLPDGQIIPLKKFAPMGSALCFPTQCILFSAIIERSLRRAARRSERFDAFWTVYGDDLIVPSHVYQDVITSLEALGFTVNKTKSYCTGYYRESCGKEYYKGVDISPLYYRTPFYSKRATPAAYGSWCSAANNAFLHRLPLYRLHLVHKCMSVSKRLGPYFVETPHTSPKLYSVAPTNFHTEARWSRRYQRLEGKFILVKSRPRDVELADDTFRYFCELVSLAKRSSTPRPDDASTPPVAMQGCVEQFSSALLPIKPFTYSLRLGDWYSEET